MTITITPDEAAMLEMALTYFFVRAMGARKEELSISRALSMKEFMSAAETFCEKMLVATGEAVN